MKKEPIISIIIVMIVIVLDIITQKYTKNVMGDITNDMIEVREELKNDNSTLARDKIKIAKEKWDEAKEKLVVYIEHTELEKVEMYILETGSYIDTKEYAMAIQSIDTCNFMIEHIEEKYKLSLQNIF